MKTAICILAKDAEATLPLTIAALDDAGAGADAAIQIVEYGSRDETARLARALAAADPRIHVHEIALADKAHAWNDYAHRIAYEAEMHVFIDASARPAPGALKALALALKSSPKAYAAAGLPTTGRSRKQWTARLFNEHYLSSPLYALRGSTLDRFRAEDIRLPIGLIGEDGLLSYIFVTDFKGGEDDAKRVRIAIAAGAFFEFDSLEFNTRDLARYVEQLKRFSLRHFQNELLYALLKERCLGAMPDRIDELYRPESIARLAPRSGAQNYLFDRMALRGLAAAIR
jgi:hypothetical protein